MNTRMIDDITRFIFISDEPQPSDIIFIPGGSHPVLGEFAAELYRQGYADKILPSGGVSIKTGSFNGVKEKKDIYHKDYATDCEFLADVLRINGVPEHAVLWEDTSRFTKENALFSRRVADEAKLAIKRAIICCKNFHARRALMCYQFAFPKAELLVHPVPYFQGETEISAENWFRTEAGIKRVLGEVKRCGTQFDDEFMGLIHR